MWPFSRHLSETNLTQTDKEMCLTEELQSAEHDAAARPAGGRGHGTWKRRPSETGSTCTRDARPLVTVRWCFLEKRALKQQLLTDRPHCRFNGGTLGRRVPAVTHRSPCLQLWPGPCSAQVAGQTEKSGWVVGPGRTQGYSSHPAPHARVPYLLCPMTIMRSLSPRSCISWICTNVPVW